MAIINEHWYSMNEGILYPIDDTATGISNTNTRLPNNIIVDLYLRWPETLATTVFLASMTVTKRVISVTFQGHSGDDLLVPIATLTVVQPVTQGRHYALNPQMPGVGGWIVFGSGVKDSDYRGVFSSPTQSLLTARAARSYKELPVSGVNVLGVENKLTGVVKLKAIAPLSLAAEDREINGVLRTCVVVRLVEDSGIDGFNVPDEAQTISGYREGSVFKDYAGPCKGRPESRTCGNPEPIEFVNAVAPDCNGVLTLEFKGCAIISQTTDPCGIALDCSLGLIDACLPPQLPDSAGRLPSEYDPTNIPIPPEPPIPPESQTSASIVVIGGLPYSECFQYNVSSFFTTKLGLWGLMSDESDPYQFCPSSIGTSIGSISGSSSIVATQNVYATQTAASRNVSVWQGFDETTIGRRVETAVRILQGPAGAKHNAGIVINHRQHLSLADRFVYYTAEIDYDSQQVKISRFNGTSFQTAVSFTSPGILLDTWYRITVTTLPGAGNNVKIIARFQSTRDDSLDVTLGPLSTQNYLPETGFFGFGTNRSIARFSHFLLESIE